MCRIPFLSMVGRLTAGLAVTVLVVFALPGTNKAQASLYTYDILAQGDVAIGGPTFGQIRHVALNNSGGATFIADSAGGKALFTPTSRLAMTGDSIGGATLGNLMYTDINDSGQVVFEAAIGPGQRGIFTPTSKIAAPGDTVGGKVLSEIWSNPNINNAGTITFMGKSNTDNPYLMMGIYSQSSLIRQEDGVGGPILMIMNTENSLNNSGTVAFEGRNAANRHAIFTQNGTVATRNDVIDGIRWTGGAGGTGTTIGDSGLVGWVGQGRDAATNQLFSSTLFTQDRVIAKQGDIIDGVQVGDFIGSLPQISINNSGNVAYGVRFGATRGILVDQNKVAVTGDTILGKNVGFADRLDMNDSGQVLFGALLDSVWSLVLATPKAIDYVAQLTTGSSPILSQTVDTPATPFDLELEYLFQTPTGDLGVYVNGVSVATIPASDPVQDAFQTAVVPIDGALLGLSSVPLEFRLDGLGGSTVLLDNVVLPGLGNAGLDSGELPPWTLNLPGGSTGRVIPRPSNLAAQTSTRVASDGPWSDAQKWDPAVVPDNGTDAFAYIVDIPGGITVDVSNGDFYTLKTLNVAGQLNIHSQTSTPSGVHSDSDVIISGILRAPANSSVGTGGNLVVTPTGKAEFADSVVSARYTYNAGQIVSNADRVNTFEGNMHTTGTLKWTKGDLGLEHTTELLFFPNGSFEITSLGRLFSDTPSTVIDNAGTATKSADTTATIDVLFRNSGLLQVQQGTLRLAKDLENRADLVVTDGSAVTVGGNMYDSGNTRVIGGHLEVQGNMERANEAGSNSPIELKFESGTIFADGEVGGNMDLRDYNFQGAVSDLVRQYNRFARDPSAPPPELRVGGSLNNHNTNAVFEGDGILNVGEDFQTGGRTAVRSVRVNVGGDTIVNSGGTFSVEDGATFTGARAFTVEAGGEAFVGSTATFHFQAVAINGKLGVRAGLFRVDGRVYVGAGVEAGGLLEIDVQGDGQGVQGDVTNGGQLRPGSSPGLALIDGDYWQTATGSLQIELAGPEPVTGFDVLEVTGEASLDGDLRVLLLPGLDVPQGATFDFLKAGSLITSEFATLELPIDEFGQPLFSVNYNYASDLVQLTALRDISIAIPEPATSMLAATALVWLLVGLWRRRKRAA